MDPFTYANLANANFIESLYADYLQNPDSVDLSWRRFFEGVQFAASDKGASPKAQLEGADLRTFFLLQAYRMYGHTVARCNPLFEPEGEESRLSLDRFGLSEADLGTVFPTFGVLEEPGAPLSAIIDAARGIYCSSVGYEFMHIENEELVHFIQERIEPSLRRSLSKECKAAILDRLIRAEGFESYIQKKHQGKKRFSVEGGETLIPVMDALVEGAAEGGVLEMRAGMAHRGRLNVLANILGKPLSALFYEFDGHYVPEKGEGSGDVKYHKGYSADHTTRGGKTIHLSLEANPSHLEAVNPVVEGSVRAKQDLVYRDPKKAVALLIHGDASLAGQGVVYETLQLCNLDGYSTGGTLHIVVNNQLGFTANPHESRSTRYCTDIALPFGAPIFHVNAEDPEMCVAIAYLAAEIRQQFGCDVFIDLQCWRKYGHNETDEPGFTQPLLYEKVKAKTPIHTLYKDKVLSEGALSADEVAAIEKAFQDDIAAAEATEKPAPQTGWENSGEGVDTRLPKEQLIALAKEFCAVPEGFAVHSKVGRLLNERLAAIESGEKIDWGAAEHLAFSSLITEGCPIRLSGQDSRRGTFSHRHSCLVDQKSEETYLPLEHLREAKAPFYAYNSSLSEYSVMGFEFGYAMHALDGLVIWEGQFGDFANGAQIMIDQFISSSEQKWGRYSHIVLFLPHGYEGMGPEHSSARMERFLQLAAQENMRIVVPTKPSQVFHLFRAQAKSPTKKPLILFSPKGLLRYAPSLSTHNDFTETGFLPLIDDPMPKARRVLFCTGKVYYDLLAEREKRQIQDVALVRLEELYPLPDMAPLFKKYEGAELFWVQEEHQNMGAWSYIQEQVPGLTYVGRARAASTAAGYPSLHEEEKKAFLDKAFDR